MRTLSLSYVSLQALTRKICSVVLESLLYFMIIVISILQLFYYYKAREQCLL